MKPAAVATADAPVCLACGQPLSLSDQHVIYSYDPRYSGAFVYCPSCGSHTVTPGVNYEALYATRDSSNYPQEGLLVRLKQQLLRSTAGKLLRGVPRSARILDYGCGGGELANAIRTQGFSNVAAADVQQSAPSSLRQGIEYIPVEHLDDAGKFDLIILRHVIEHLESPLETLKRLRVALAPGGRVLLEFPCPDSVWRTILRGRWPGYFYPFHTMVLTVEGLRRLSANAGLVVEETSRAEPPIMGALFMGLGVPRTYARVLSIAAYPIQVTLNFLARRSEATCATLVRK